MLSGISQAELEVLFEIKPVAHSPRPALKKAMRTPFSVQRLLLQCLIAKPELGRRMPEGWHGEGAEGEAIEAVLSALQEADFAMSSPALMQMFEGTIHGKALSQAEADMLDWGASFDVEAEFSGLIERLDDGRRREEFQALQGKLAQGGPSSLSPEELQQYRRLLQR